MAFASHGLHSIHRYAVICKYPHRQVIRRTVQTNSPRSSSNSSSSRSSSSTRDVYRQHSLKDGTLRYKLRNGFPTVGVVTGFHNDTDHVETLGLLGYDFLWADAEHSSAGPESVASLILAAERRGMPTLVRIGYGYQNIIGHSQKFLVAGAQGIILPQCESRQDAEKIVEAVKFPPIGKRGLAGERWNAWGLGGETTTLAERVEECNHNSVVGVIVESRRGIEALDDILGLPELDFVFVAPTDLSADLGLHGQIRHPKVVELVEAAGQKIRAAGVASGMLALTAQDYSFWRNRGFQVMCTVAHNLFVDGAKSMMDGIVQHELGAVEQLKKTALKLMASNLTDQDVETMKQVFQAIDSNGDGQLSLKELDDALYSGAFPPDLVEKLKMLRGDWVLAVGHNDLLDWNDFLAGTLDERLLVNEANLRQAFADFRRHSDASSSNVTISDLTKMFGGEAVAQQIMDQVDADGDRSMSFEEFRSAVLRSSKNDKKK
jgi:4-hydroxy-2-oxoheptanedioate aldolase